MVVVMDGVVPENVRAALLPVRVRLGVETELANVGLATTFNAPDDTAKLVPVKSVTVSPLILNA